MGLAGKTARCLQGAPASADPGPVLRAGQDMPGRDADANDDRIDLVHRRVVAHLERRPDGPHGVVLASHGEPENGGDAVVG